MTPVRWVLRKLREQILWRITVPLRSAYWGLFLARLGKGTKMLGHVGIAVPHQLSIGRHCTLNEGVSINAYSPVVIGDYVRISSGVVISSAGLDYEAAMDKRHHLPGPVTIEDGAWIGAGAVINPGVVVGRDSVVGAGAVVTKDVPPSTVVVGVPARILKTIEHSAT